MEYMHGVGITATVERDESRDGSRGPLHLISSEVTLILLKLFPGWNGKVEWAGEVGEFIVSLPLDTAHELIAHGEWSATVDIHLGLSSLPYRVNLNAAWPS